jgi:hypothetical protein
VRADLPLRVALTLPPALALALALALLLGLRLLRVGLDELAWTRGGAVTIGRLIPRA